MIARARQRRCGNQQEALRAGNRRVGVERFRRHELLDLGVPRRRLQVLAHGQEIDAGGAHVVHHLVDFEPLLAEPDHQPRFGEDVRRLALDALEQAQ